EEYQNIKNSISNLDDEYEQFKTEQASLNALNNSQKPNIDFFNIKNNGVAIKNNDEDIYSSMEYRKAFMNHVLKGDKIPAEFLNSSEVTKTKDIGIMIPNNILNKIIEKMESYGMILPLVTRTSYKGGVTIPSSNIKPVAVWVNEGEGSPTQKKEVKGSLTFAYHKLRCAVAISLETDTMAMSAFEAALINDVARAMTVALESAIIKGDGAGKPKGILTEEIDDSKIVELVDGKVNYNTLIEAESCLDLAYENGAVWFMHKATFMSFVGMVDNNGQPIARTNYGIEGKPERTLLGRKVVLNEYMPSIKSQITEDEVVAFLFNPSDYVLNTNLNITVKKYVNEETDDTITKSIMLVDGKVVDNNSLVTVVKKH
ncbi:MAG: phage major capsid protein, partial [Eubacteriales bacterium]|nr:phage major capsid protein [Eubacteriales bacterium]